MADPLVCALLPLPLAGGVGLFCSITDTVTPDYDLPVVAPLVCPLLPLPLAGGEGLFCGRTDTVIPDSSSTPSTENEASCKKTSFLHMGK